MVFSKEGRKFGQEPSSLNRYLYPSILNRAIECCDFRHLQSFATYYDHSHELADLIAYLIVGTVYDVRLEDDGSLRLPDEFVKKCGIGEEAVLVGRGRSFEIWCPDEFR